jgi:Transposase
VGQVIIGMDPHRRAATIEVIDDRENVLAAGRFGTDCDGYKAMLTLGRRHPQRVWAVEDCNGIGRHIAQRLVVDGETVIDVPAKLSARARVFATGQGREIDPVDAHIVAVVALRAKGLRQVCVDDATVALRLLVDRRDGLGQARTDLINREGSQMRTGQLLAAMAARRCPWVSSSNATSRTRGTVVGAVLIVATAIRAGRRAAKRCRGRRSAASPATAACSHHGINLELHQPLRIDKTRYFYEGARRSYLREPFAMCARRLSPTGDVNKHDPSSDHVCQRCTGLAQRLLGDVQATHGLRVHISRTGCGTVVRDRRGAGHGYVRPDPHGA